MILRIDHEANDLDGVIFGDLFVGDLGDHTTEAVSQRVRLVEVTDLTHWGEVRLEDATTQSDCFVCSHDGLLFF